jgi:hypothetical protein
MPFSVFNPGSQAPAWEPSDTKLHSNGGTGFQPVHAQAEACGYQKLTYDFDLV